MTDPRFAELDRRRAADTVRRDTEIFGTTFTYEGQPLDPTKVVMHIRKADGEHVEVEEYDEWCLTGQPEGDRPFYCATGHTPEEIRLLKAIWSAIEAGHPDYHWANAALERRHVRIERTPWVTAEAEATDG